MRLFNMRVDVKSAALGAVAMLAACIVPKISDITSGIIGKIRGMIGGNAK